jgi:ABC-type transporter Mla subunit MlaD
MRGRSRAGALAASPTMVGAITTLVVIVAVFLAYNANSGLPFVPVYRVSVDMCDAARLSPNNEVRIGGNRVGVVESLETVELDEAAGCRTSSGVSSTAAARLNLKLDETADPLPSDSQVTVRYRSSFGLKYLEIVRGEGEGLPDGGSLALSNASEQTEFDDIANTFDTETREAARRNLEGFGTGFAARGASLNQAIESFNPLFGNLEPVSRALADPGTALERFFPELADAARIVAPVAEDNAQLFTNAATAFAAVSSDEEALRDSISGGVGVLAEGVESLPVQQPFLRDFAEVSRLLRPGVRDLRISLPALNGAISAGAKTLPRTERTFTDLEGAFVELEDFVDEPSTKATLLRLSDTFDSGASATEQIGPYQTVCNYWNYWFTYLVEHFAQPTQFGTAERIILTGAPGATSPQHFPRNPLDNYSGSQADGRFSDLADPPGQFSPHDIPILHGNPYGPSGTEEVPNCQAGQTGYALGQARIPGQGPDSPVFGVQNIGQATGLGPLGRTDLFLTQTGDRIFWDSP